MPRTLLALLAALTVLVSGCGTTGADTPQGRAQLADQQGRLRQPRIPSDPPYYGSIKPGDTVRTSGHRPRPVHRLPFTHGILSEGQLRKDTTKSGVRDFVYHGIHYKHPVAIAQYGLAQLDVAQRHKKQGKPFAKHLRIAKANAAALLEAGVAHGRELWFPYPFDFNLGSYEGHTIHAPWWSAMAQGEALSLFTRLYETTHEPRWHTAAERTFRTLDDRGPRPKGQPWSTYVDTHGYLWFEEYAGDTVPLIVLNGDMFALFGVYDYARMTGSAKAAKMFDAGVTTLREYVPLFRSKGHISFYCLRQPFCHKKSWQSADYHGIVTRELRFIGDMTDDPWFGREANRFERDYDAWPLKPEWYS